MTDRLRDLMKEPRWEGWAQEQETLDFFKELRDMSEDLRWQWANRAFEDPDPHVWVTKNSMALAQIDMLESLLNIFDTVGVHEDGEQVGVEGEIGSGTGGPVQGPGEGG